MRPSRAAGQIHQQKLLLLLAWLVGLSSGPGCRPRSPCLQPHSRHWRRCAGSQPCRHRSRPDPHAHELVVICTASSLPSSCPLHRRGAPAQIKRGRHSPAPNLVGDNQARAAVPSPHPSEVKQVGAKPPPGRRRWRPPWRAPAPASASPLGLGIASPCPSPRATLLAWVPPGILDP